MRNRNRLHNVTNSAQGAYKRVLCVCSAGLLRSPTAALVLAGEPFNFNTRAAGSAREYALVRVDEVLLAWADEVVFMEEDNRREVEAEFGDIVKPTAVFDLADNFDYRDPELVRLIAKEYTRAWPRLRAAAAKAEK